MGSDQGRNLFPSERSEKHIEMRDEASAGNPHANKATDKPHQRIGSVSNAHVGADFELVALEFFATQGIILTRKFAVELGLSKKKTHRFDLGTAGAKILVEFMEWDETTGDIVKV